MHLVEVAKGLAPQLCLNADDVVGLLEFHLALGSSGDVDGSAIGSGACAGIDVGGQSIPGIDFVDLATPVQSLLVLVPTVAHVHVEVGHVGQDDGITVVGQAIRHVSTRAHSAPGVHTGHARNHQRIVLGGVVKAYFLPTFDTDFAGFEQGADAFQEISMHVVLVLETLALHERLHIGALIPCTTGHLVTAQVDDLEFKAGFLVHLLQLTDHVVDEQVNIVAGNVEHVVVITLCRGIDTLVLLVPQTVLLCGGVVRCTVLHRHDGSAGMAWRLNFGDDVHASLPSIAEQVDELAAGEVAVGTLRQVVGVAVAVKDLCQVTFLVERGAAARSHLGQLGQAGNLQAPGFVVGEVELQRVDLVVGQQVNQPFHLGRTGHIVACDVKVHAAVAEVRPVDDKAVLQAVSLAVVQRGDERLHTVDQSGTGGAVDADASVMHAQAVVLAVSAHLFVEQQLDDGVLAAGHIDAAFLQFIGEQVLGTAVSAPLEELAVLDGHDAAHLCETVLDIHLLGGGEDVIVITRVAVAKAIDGLVVIVHVVAVRVSLVVAPLAGLVERRPVDVHRDGVGHVTAHHHMTAGRHVALVDDSAAHHHFHHERIAGSDGLVVAVGLDAVIGRRHLLDVHRAACRHGHLARELVEEELPVVAERLIADVLDDKT